MNTPEVEPWGVQQRVLPRCVVLAIDDEEMLRRLSKILEYDQHHVIELEDGAELVDYFELLSARPKSVARPDVVVAQLSLPGVSGLSVLLNRRISGDHTPFIFFVDGREGIAELQAAHDAFTIQLAFPRDVPTLRVLLRERGPILSQYADVASR